MGHYLLDTGLLHQRQSIWSTMFPGKEALPSCVSEPPDYLETQENALKGRLQAVPLERNF